MDKVGVRTVTWLSGLGRHSTASTACFESTRNSVSTFVRVDLQQKSSPSVPHPGLREVGSANSPVRPQPPPWRDGRRECPEVHSSPNILGPVASGSCVSEDLKLDVPDWESLLRHEPKVQVRRLLRLNFSVFRSSSNNLLRPLMCFILLRI